MNNKHEIREETCVFDGTTYTNKIISIDGIKICVLDFEIIIRDPVFSKGQFANHINIYNVGGTIQFLRYFDKPVGKSFIVLSMWKNTFGQFGNMYTHFDAFKKSV